MRRVYRSIKWVVLCVGIVTFMAGTVTSHQETVQDGLIFILMGVVLFHLENHEDRGER